MIFHFAASSLFAASAGFEFHINPIPAIFFGIASICFFITGLLNAFIKDEKREEEFKKELQKINKVKTNAL